MPSGDVVVSSALKNVYAKITYIVYFYVNKYICIILIKIRCSNWQTLPIDKKFQIWLEKFL